MNGNGSSTIEAPAWHSTGASGSRVLVPASALDALADALAARLNAARVDDPWMTSQEAASYLGLSLDALHRLTAARRIPFTQDTPAGRLYFKRAELDSWRR